MTVAMFVGPLAVRTVPCRARDPCGLVARLVTRRNLRGGRESFGTGGSRLQRARIEWPHAASEQAGHPKVPLFFTRWRRLTAFSAAAERSQQPREVCRESA